MEEKYVSKKLKTYKNEIRPEETAVRLYPGQERGIGVTLDTKAKATVKISSESKDIEIVENSVFEMTEENSEDPFKEFKIKVKEDAKVGTKAKIRLSAKDMADEYVIISIDTVPKDTENIIFFKLKLGF